jgi:hypothetical protein
VPLPWVRLDTSMPDNPKVLRMAQTPAGKAAAFVWVCSIAYAGKHGTDGYIPPEALSRCNGTRADATKLVEVGLWDVDPATGGWIIHGWTEFQMSNEETQRRSDRARTAALKRWGKDPPAMLNGMRNA